MCYRRRSGGAWLRSVEVVVGGRAARQSRLVETEGGLARACRVWDAADDMGGWGGEAASRSAGGELADGGLRGCTPQLTARWHMRAEGS